MLARCVARLSDSEEQIQALEVQAEKDRVKLVQLTSEALQHKQEVMKTRQNMHKSECMTVGGYWIPLNT